MCATFLCALLATATELEFVPQNGNTPCIINGDSGELEISCGVHMQGEPLATRDWVTQKLEARIDALSANVTAAIAKSAASGICTQWMKGSSSGTRQMPVPNDFKFAQIYVKGGGGGSMWNRGSGGQGEIATATIDLVQTGTDTIEFHNGEGGRSGQANHAGWNGDPSYATSNSGNWRIEGAGGKGGCVISTCSGGPYNPPVPPASKSDVSFPKNTGYLPSTFMYYYCSGSGDYKCNNNRLFDCCNVGIQIFPFKELTQMGKPGNPSAGNGNAPGGQGSTFVRFCQ